MTSKIIKVIEKPHTAEKPHALSGAGDFQSPEIFGIDKSESFGNFPIPTTHINQRYTHINQRYTHINQRYTHINQRTGVKEAPVAAHSNHTHQRSGILAHPHARAYTHSHSSFRPLGSAQSCSHSKYFPQIIHFHSMFFACLLFFLQQYPVEAQHTASQRIKMDKLHGIGAEVL